ncbi:unnamed protein product [Rotaria sordida]|uniref:Uncharacterized protein n=1 Tax=Rotaria sordida TaxID=392033 RepID=A0A818QK59_9BILA|nr:unnamed protein product [Rotaria sordida]CAF3638406.1 unnamed protein product [Rotaria sordida]
MVLLVYFKSLPCLSSLTVCFGDFDDDLGDVYQFIFHLSSLKYFKLKILEYYRSNLNTPIATNEQFSSLEYLVISHLVYLNELTHLLSYTPQLSHLYCSNIIQSEELMKLNNLLFSQLRVLTVTINCSDNNYLNGFRREQLINHHMPVKKKFKNHTSPSNYTHPGVRVHIKKSQHTPGNQIFINKINSLFSLMDITSLVINCHQMSANHTMGYLISI